MATNQGFSRIDYLSLNVKSIQNHLESGQCTQLSVFEGDQNKHVDDSLWVLSSSNQVAVSRNKIGKPLLKAQRHEFLLDDPFMNSTRFFVEYHRLQDPGLKRYFKSVPVRKRLEELCMLSEENDAICSTKEMTDYLRYLDHLRSLEQAGSIKQTEKKRLANHFRKIGEDKKQTAKLVDTFRRSKYRKDLAEDIHKKKRTSSKQIESAKRTTERVNKVKEEYLNKIQRKNREKQEKLNANKLIIAQNEAKRRKQAKEMLELKLELAQQRKENLQNEKSMAKNIEAIRHFEEHWRFREQTQLKNIKLFEMYEKTRKENLENRRKQIEEIREKDAIKKLKIRRNLDIKNSNEKIVEIIVKQMKTLSKKYRKLAEPSQLVEVSRRFSLLTQPFITDCLEEVSETLRKLKITFSYAILVRKTLGLMQQLIILLPDVGPSSCILVRERTAEIIAIGVTHIKNERLKNIREDRKKKSKPDLIVKSAEENAPTSRVKKQVSMNEVTEIIQEPLYYELDEENKMNSKQKSDEIV